MNEKSLRKLGKVRVEKRKNLIGHVMMTDEGELSST